VFNRSLESVAQGGQLAQILAVMTPISSIRPLLQRAAACMDREGGIMNGVTRRAFCCAALAMTIGPALAADPPPGGIKWQTDINVAHRLSQQSNKPMLFVFGADWCTWCKKLEKTTLTNRELVHHINMHFVPVHIDADKDPRVVEILEAQALPCAVILSPNADLLGRINGFKDAPAYQAALTAARGPATSVLPVKAEQGVH
jgi:thiol-disulfide isomerase/thioredoxin